MFRQDVRYFSILDLVEGIDLKNFLRDFYLKYYAKIFYVFQFYQAESVTYPGLSWMTLNQIISECNFFQFYQTFDENKNKVQVSGFTEGQSDVIFKEVIEVIEEVLGHEHSGSQYFSKNNNSVNRAGFMSYLARIALLINRGNPFIKPSESLDLFFSQFFRYSQSSYSEYQIKKTQEIQTESVSSVLHLFQLETEEVYDELKGVDGLVSLKAVIDWMDMGEVILGEKLIQKCFLYSKMPVIEEYVVSGKSYTNMEYVEFLEFLVRISELDFYNKQDIKLKDKVERTFKKIFFIF